MKVREILSNLPKVKDLVLGRVESTGLSEPSTCALYPQVMWPLVKGCAFCRLEFVSPGEEHSLGTTEDRREFYGYGSLRIRLWAPLVLML